MYLESLGHRLLRHNYHLGYIEIDLITQDADEIIHFVEVKQWRSRAEVHPLEAFTDRRRKLCQRAAATFLAELGAADGRSPDEWAISFDLVWLKAGTDELELFTQLF